MFFGPAVGKWKNERVTELPLRDWREDVKDKSQQSEICWTMIGEEDLKGPKMDSSKNGGRQLP